MAKIEKRFDAVRMMRSIRDELDEKIRGMTLEQQQTYIRQRLRAGSTDRINGAALRTTPAPAGLPRALYPDTPRIAVSLRLHGLRPTCGRTSAPRKIDPATVLPATWFSSPYRFTVQLPSRRSRAGRAPSDRAPGRAGPAVPAARYRGACFSSFRNNVDVDVRRRQPRAPACCFPVDDALRTHSA